MSQRRPIVAHAVSHYLFPTGTWIYSQLLNLKRFRSIVLTSKTSNLDDFPFEPIYSYETVSTVHKAMLCVRTGRLRNARHPFFEQVMRREGASLLHAHFGHTGVDFLDLKARMKVPLITTFYGADVAQLPRERKWREAYRRLFSEGELVLAEGSAMRRNLIELGCPPERVILQHLGIPIDTFRFEERRPSASGAVRILIAAVFRQKKGIPDALRAIERVRQRHPKVEVTLIGDSAGKCGDEQEKQKILELLPRLGSSVRWLGFCSYAEYRAALYAHDIFVSPSVTADDGDSEGGAPVSLIEAQATGMPVIATRHADIPEIVLDERSGLLSPEKDLDALTSNLERAVSNPDSWGPMGHCGRTHVQTNHEIGRQMGKLESIYGSLIGAEVHAYARTSIAYFGTLASFLVTGA